MPVNEDVVVPGFVLVGQIARLALPGPRAPPVSHTLPWDMWLPRCLVWGCVSYGGCFPWEL